MDQPTPSYRSEFFRSKYHAWLGVLTLGMGFVFGADRPLFLLLGAAAYALGWIYLPDLPFFRRAVDQRREVAHQTEANRQLGEFQQKRDAMLASIGSHLRQRYSELAEVCRQIEKASAEGPLAEGNLPDPRLRKLDELMWTFLRLLAMQDATERFLETERREDLPGLMRETEASIASLTTEVDALKKQPSANARASKEQLLQSRMESLEVLRKRQARVEQAQADLALVLSEQERLESQIKLIRADAMAANNPANISARIDATVEHLNQTNRWLTEMGQFEDLVGDLPSLEARLGYQPVTPPPIIPVAGTRRRNSSSTSDK